MDPLTLMIIASIVGAGAFGTKMLGDSRRFKLGTKQIESQEKMGLAQMGATKETNRLNIEQASKDQALALRLKREDRAEGRMERSSDRRMQSDSMLMQTIVAMMNKSRDDTTAKMRPEGQRATLAALLGAR